MEKDKDLLLKDLCARLGCSNDVKINYNNNIYDLLSVNRGQLSIGIAKVGEWFPNVEIYKCKPYLRPMSSMTEEEVKDLIKVHIRRYGLNSNYIKNLISIDRISFYERDKDWSAWIKFKDENGHITTTCFIVGRINWETTLDEIMWLDKNMFDYRGIIPKGLALVAREGMYKND